MASLLFLLCPLPAVAQRERGEVRVEVRDQVGMGVAASGEILSQGNEFRRSFQIGNDGNYVLQDLPYGVYRLSLQAQGFAVWNDVVEVHSVVPIRVGVSLSVASITTKVQVTEEKTLVDPTSTGSLFMIGRQSIQENLSAQPGRDLLDLTASQPGWLFEANGVLHPRGSEYDVQFVVDGQPLTQNRSPALAPDMDSDEVESMRVLTANFPAEFGRKLGGIVEVTTDKSIPLGWHGELDASGGSFGSISGTAAVSFVAAKNRFSARASGLHSDRYLDPPVVENYTNQGNSGGIVGEYEHEFESDDRLRVTFLHDTLGYIVPNDLVQQNQLIGPQRQDASSVENGGQVYFQHSISPTLFLTVSGALRESSFVLRSNILSTPIIVEQNRGYTEGYVRSDIAGHHGHHDWKAGIDSFFTPVHEALAYHITDPSQFDPGTQVNFQFHEQKWDFEPSFYIQDQMHYGHWNLSAGLRFDYYSFVVNKTALSPRVGLSYFISSWDLLLHASYDRIFQTPAIENLLLASSPEFDSVSPVVLRLPVPPSQGNFYEIGFTKAAFAKLRLDANFFCRDFRNFADDDVLLQTGVNFPIAYANAHICGEEVRLSAPNWGRFSGFVSYANQSALGQEPFTGGLFLGNEAANSLTGTSKFAMSQDQRNTLRARARLQVERRLWFALAAQYGSGLPADLADNPDPASLVAQFGANVVSRVNFTRDRVGPNFSLDLGAGAELYRKEVKTVQVQFQATNLTDRLNVINFASLFSGTAVGLPRSFSARLRVTF